MTPEDALYRGITGRYSRASEGGPVHAMVTELARTLGTRPPAGISARTWRRLRSDPGHKVTPKTRGALADAQRRARLTTGRETRLRGTPRIVVQGVIKISSDERQRTLDISGWPDAPERPITGMMGDVLQPWLSGDDPAAVEAFLAPPSASIGSQVHLGDVDFIRFT